VDGVFAEESRAALGNHHRVNHQVADSVSLDLIRDRLDDLGAGEHPSLGRLDAEVLHDGVDLGPDHRHRELQDVGDRQRVLGGDGGDRGGAVDSEGREGLEVRLDARATARVRAGDGEGDGQLHAGWRRRAPQ